MIATLLHWLGIPTRAEVEALHEDITDTRERAKAADAAIVAAIHALEQDIRALTGRLLAARTELAELRRTVGAQRARIEALEEQPQRRPAAFRHDAPPALKKSGEAVRVHLDAAITDAVNQRAEAENAAIRRQLASLGLTVEEAPGKVRIVQRAGELPVVEVLPPVLVEPFPAPKDP